MPNLTRTNSQLPLPITIPASDPDGDPLSITATVTNITNYQAIADPVLYYSGSFYQNQYGQNEKWLKSALTLGWYCILPNGEFRAFANNPPRVGALVLMLDSSYWVDGSKLYMQPWAQTVARATQILTQYASQVTATVDQATKKLVIRAPAGYHGTLRVTVRVSDGIASVSRIFTVTVP